MIFEKLEKKVIFYWMLLRLTLIAIVTVGLVVGITQIPNEYLWIFLIPVGLLLLFSVFYSLILPFWNYKVYKYHIGDEKIIISRGVLFRHYSIIPVIQIQDITTFQGPIQMMFKISSILITTAGSTNAIWAVNSKKAKGIVEDIQVKIHNRVTFKLEEKENASL